MANSRLQNYLRTYRRRLGLSQADVAMLLGTAPGTKVSRYENFSRIPQAPTIFALEVIFKQPARELFAGTYDEIREAVQERARTISNDLLGAQAVGDKETLRKVQVLRAIVEPPQNPKSLQ